MMSVDHYIELAKKVFHEKNDVEYVISKLKENGASQGESSYALVRGLGLELREADNTVMKSPSWVAQKDSTNAFRETFWNTFVEGDKKDDRAD